MLFKGRRQSSNIEDIRSSRGGGRGFFKGGLLGVIIVGAIVYFMGGNPMEVLNLMNGSGSYSETPIEFSTQEKEMAEFVSVVLADTEDVWHKLLNEQGVDYIEPKLVLFSGSVNSACGMAQSATGPFYCPADHKVYIDLNYLSELQHRLGATGDFAVAYIIAHEVGHHVQNLLGIIDNINQQQANAATTQANALNVKLELHADFLAGIWVHHIQKSKNILESGDLEEALNAASSVGDDNIQMTTQGYVTPDAFTHGSAADRKLWLKSGIESGNLLQGASLVAQ